MSIAYVSFSLYNATTSHNKLFQKMGGSKLIQIICHILPVGMALYTSSTFIFKCGFNLVVVTRKEPVYKLIVSLMSQVGY